MAVRITIETGSKAEAELIADRLPVKATAQSWRGLGVIRLALKRKEDTNDLLEAVSLGFAEHKLQWTRVRYGDEERVFKANAHQNGHRAG